MKAAVSSIAPLRENQIDAAIDLFCAQLTEHNLPNNAAEIRPVIQQYLADDSHGFILAATAPDNTVVGIALCCAYLGVEHGGPSGWIEELYVKPEARGHGLGSRLIEEIIRTARARNWRALDLEVTEDHQRVITLYRRHGFKAHARTRFFLKLKT